MNINKRIADRFLALEKVFALRKMENRSKVYVMHQALIPSSLNLSLQSYYVSLFNSVAIFKVNKTE